MITSKLLGFYSFNITADKTRDFFLKNGFHAADLVITKIVPGEDPFITDVKEGTAETTPTATSDNSHPVREFFQHLLHFGRKATTIQEPFIPEDGGYILSVTTASEDRQLAKEILEDHGAQYLKIFDN